MKPREVARHEARIQGVLRAAWVDHGWSAATDDTPLDALMDGEFEPEELDHEPARGGYAWPSADVSEMERIEITTLKREEALMVAAWARRRMVMWIIGDGLHPFHIVQRFYALLFSRYQEFLGPLNQTWLAAILNQGRAAFSAVVKRLFTRPIKLKTGLVMVSPGMKSAESKEKYAANAAKHKPRSNHDAARLSPDDEEAAWKAMVKANKEHLRALRQQAEQRRLATLTGCRPEEIDLDKSNPHSDDHE